MKPIFKRTLSLLLALMLIMSLSIPAFAATKSVTYLTGTYYVQMPMVEGNGYATPQFSIAWGNKNFTITRADVKLKPGTTDAKLISFRKQSNTEFQEAANQNGVWETNINNKNYRYVIGIKVSKPGTATLTYRVGENTYKVKLVFVPYTNSIKTLNITGINSNKNLASLTKNSCCPSKALNLTTTTKSAKAMLTAADGWKVTQLQLTDQTTGITRMINCNNGTSALTLSLGTLNVKHNYTLHYICRSTSTNWTVGNSFYIHGAKAP